VLRLIVRYALTHDAAGVIVLRDDEAEEIVGFPFASNGTDLELLVRECEFNFYTHAERHAAKLALQAAGFQVDAK
jgi:hypothetical protein